MSVYPDIISSGIRATLPLEHATSQAVLVTEFENGVEQRRLLWDSVRRNVTINYSILYFEYANELRRFYEARKGSFESFSFFFPQIEVYVKELVGVIASSTIVIKLPSKDAQFYSLYENNRVSPLAPSEWTFNASAGPDGEDMATLGFVPTIGDIYHFSFTGRLKIKARFDTAPQTFQDTKEYWSTTVVNLVGLEPDLNFVIEP